jgi:hypothetical protein
MNAMSAVATRSVAAQGFERIRLDPRIDVIPHNVNSSLDALDLFTLRTDKEWSLTDCLSFVVMAQRHIREALTADRHFEQAGFRAALAGDPPDH